MDNYQKFMIKNIDAAIEYPEDKLIKLHILENETIEIQQESDITITKYVLHIKSLFISNLWIEKNGKKTKQTFKTEDYYKDFKYKIYKIVLDFNEKIDFIHIEFEKNYADPYTLNISYIDADKDAYFSKIATEKRTALLDKMSVKHRTGDNLINIYFQPCCKDYNKTEIELYTATGRSEYRKSAVETLMGKFSVEDGMYFKSITGLAKGAYAFALSQYSVKGELLLKTDFIFFVIN
jgi:hypothetical protein